MRMLTEQSTPAAEKTLDITTITLLNLTQLAAQAFPPALLQRASKP